MLTGDYMSHSDWTYTRQGHLDVIANFSGLIENYFPHTPIFWGIGNHEGVPVNSFAPHFAPSQFRPQWLYKAIYSANRPWIPTEENPTMIYRGSYTVMLTEKLKLISLNTGYCETTNFFLYINQTDPDQTLSWLVNELYKSEQMNQSAHIMAHIPPGDVECLEGWSRNYYRIVNRFEKTIKAQFFGHVHTDAFTVFYENMDDFHSRPTSVLYMAPSVTTFEHLNPAYRIYTIDGNYRDSSYEVLDFETYFLNLTATKDTDQPKWELLYKAKEEYGLDDLAAKSWHSLSEQIRTNNTIYDIFLKNYARRHDYPCNEHCRAELLCSLRRGHHNETALCPEVSFIRGKLFPALFKRQFPSVEPTVEEPFTRDSFIVATKKTIWDKLAKWIRER
ncbi:calcineurin-like phosphoesterase domain-containing protein [Ditylenchus destructor]|nr:calcineurin-like phosphoesterase domain-containing protein [Ditylenchus destructor]